jgi:hypothetical protein
MFKLQFPESRIAEFANQYISKNKNQKNEDELIGFRDQIQHVGYLTKIQLNKLCKWKAARSAGYVNKNKPSFIKEITQFALSTSDERARIESLTLLDGVAWPTASVILHLYHRENYPILDFRALESVGREEPKQYRFQFWYEYTLFCRKIAENNKVEMRTLDQALWQYSKNKQKRQPNK